MEAVLNYFEAASFMRDLYQNSVLVLRDGHKTVREYLFDSGSDKNRVVTKLYWSSNSISYSINVVLTATPQQVNSSYLHSVYLSLKK